MADTSGPGPPGAVAGPTLRAVTTPPGNPPDPFRPGDRGSEPPAGSSPSEPSRPSWEQPPGYQQPTYPAQGGQPWDQQQGQPQQGYPQGGYPQQNYPQQGYPQGGGYGQPGQYGEPAKANGFGIAALVLGILSLPAAFFGGIPGILLGGLALVFGILGLRRVKARRADNRGMAIAGLVTGILGLVLGILVLILTVFVFQTAGECLTEFNQTGDQAAYEQCIQDLGTS